MPEESISKSWWHTLPGVLTAIAAIITAATGLVAALNQSGYFNRMGKSPSSEIRTLIELPANAQDWLDTGVALLSGQRLEITASGEINYQGTNPQTKSGPEGSPHITCDFPGCVAQGQAAGKLYGRIGGEAPFPVGTHVRFNVKDGGRLWLKVNDHVFSDNTGKFAVTVNLQTLQ